MTTNSPSSAPFFAISLHVHARTGCCMLLLLFGITLPAWGQIDTTRRTQETEINLLIEDAATNIEIEGQADFSFFTDRLEDLRRRPLNLNRASRTELLQLPGMTDVLAVALLQYIGQFGALSSVYELQAVPGFDGDLIANILPFVQTTSAREKDISPGKRHAAGPPLREVLQGLNGEFIQRVSFQVENARGYSPPDSTFRERFDDDGELSGIDTLLSSRYAGSKYQSYSRARLRYGQHFSMALTGEKDEGEAFRWNPATREYGYDFLSGHLAVGQYGHLKQLVVGDYNLSFGQGLALSRGIGFGKGAEVIQAVKQNGRGIVPYASVNEAQFMRGAAATVAAGDFYLTGFYSSRRLDGSVRAIADSLEDIDSEAAIGSLQFGGLHRTPSELKNRNALAEQIFGGRLALQRRSLTAAVMAYEQHFDLPVQPVESFYNRYRFRGTLNRVISADWDWVFRNFNFFGEIARSRSGGIALSSGLMGSLSPQMDVVLQFRSFDVDYHTTRGFAFAERPIQVQNEQGLYAGLRLRPTGKWTLSAYFDQYYNRWDNFQISYPSRGFEYLLQADYKPSRNTLLYFRFRDDHKERNASNAPQGQLMHYLIPTRRRQARIHFQTILDKKVTLRTRFEWSAFRDDIEPDEYGFMMYQDLIWKPNFVFRVTARYGIFDAGSYNARIYTYENDVPGFFSIPAFSGRGSRSYLIINYQPFRNVDIWLRAAQTWLYRADSMGSGLEEIAGNRRTDIRLQIRINF